MAHSVFSIKGYFDKEIKGNKWVIDDNPRKTILIIHGMGEYSFRYNDFAEFLNSQGYDVFALDHIGHGLNLNGPQELLIWDLDTFYCCVENAHILLTKLEREGREVIVYAHSMGSFMGQSLIERHSGCVKKIVLSGSSGPQLAYGIGNFIAKTVAILSFNGRKRSKFLNKIAFSSYNAKIKKPRTSYDWLSFNEENVDKYIADPLCGGIPSRNFFASFMGGLKNIFKRKNINRISSHTEILIIAGEDDPVSNYSKSLNKLQKLYTYHGISSKMIIYKNMRHEILQEKNCQLIYRDVLNFIKN